MPGRGWKAELYRGYFYRAAEAFDPNTHPLEHSQLMREMIVADFGKLPTSVMDQDYSLNYPDEAATGRNTLGGADETDKDLYGAQKAQGGRLSVFEGRLAFNCIRLWSNPGDLILDPFAGRAARLQAALDNARAYIGFDTSPEAVAVCQQALDVRRSGEVGMFPEEAERSRIIQDSSLFLDKYVEPESADFVFTCPPYWNSEWYGDNGTGTEGTPDYRSYVEELAAILLLSAKALKPERFLCFVLRGFFLHGTFLDTPAHLERYLSGSGLMFHDQVAKKMSNSRERFHTDVVLWRRTAQVHEYVLTYYKGKPKPAKAPYRQECYDRNTNRHVLEQALANRRREVVQAAGLDPAACLPLVPVNRF